MSLGDDEWKLWREGDPFPQRFTATISEDGDKISGRWKKAEDATNYTTDFYLAYTRIGRPSLRSSGSAMRATVYFLTRGTVGW